MFVKLLVKPFAELGSGKALHSVTYTWLICHFQDTKVGVRQAISHPNSLAMFWSECNILQHCTLLHIHDQYVTSETPYSVSTQLLPRPSDHTRVRLKSTGAHNTYVTNKQYVTSETSKSGVQPCTIQEYGHTRVRLKDIGAHNTYARISNMSLPRHQSQVSTIQEYGHEVEDHCSATAHTWAIHLQNGMAELDKLKQ